MAVLALFFRNYTVNPQPHPGESVEQACVRVSKTEQEIEHKGKILCEMKYPMTIVLTCNRRKS